MPDENNSQNSCNGKPVTLTNIIKSLGSAESEQTFLVLQNLITEGRLRVDPEPKGYIYAAVDDAFVLESQSVGTVSAAGLICRFSAESTGRIKAIVLNLIDKAMNDAGKVCTRVLRKDSRIHPEVAEMLIKRIERELLDYRVKEMC